MLRRLRRLLRQQFPDEEGLLVPAVRDVTGAQLLPEHLRRPVLRVARVLAAGEQAARRSRRYEGGLMKAGW